MIKKEIVAKNIQNLKGDYFDYIKRILN
jgi:hypothetical protein